MTSARCPRSFQVEAMRDGRLVGAEQATFLRHMAQCPVCLHEAKGFDELGQRLRDGTLAEKRSDELRVARTRVQLLGAFDRTLMSSKTGLDRLRWPVALAAVSAICLLGVWRMQRPVTPRRAAEAIVRADETAVWSRRQNGKRNEITLVRGELTIRVDHPTSDRSDKVMVLLPDGELEDMGTTFTVSVVDGRTARVAVAEGSVVLRLNGKRSVALIAGQTWIHDWQRPEALAPGRADGDGDSTALAPRGATKSDPGVQPTRSTSQGRRTAVVGVRGEKPSIGASARRPVAPHIGAPEPDPALDFRAAMAMLDAGANREAAAAFARFSTRFPDDRRAEDAAYLRIIALQRSGGDVEIKRATREYLRLYPAGFRRAEVEPLSR